MGQATQVEISRDDAMGALRREYYSCITSYAEDLVSRIKAGEIASYDALTEAVDSDVDGSEWVIYTGMAQQVIFVSDNDEAYFEELGTEGALRDGSVDWSALAYFAMQRDLHEALDALGIDDNFEFGATDGEESEEEEGTEVAPVTFREQCQEFDARLSELTTDLRQFVNANQLPEVEAAERALSDLFRWYGAPFYRRQEQERASRRGEEEDA